MVVNDRSIQSIKVVDIEKRRVPSKHYLYVIQVTWDDGTCLAIYRRYSHFFSFQTTLIDSFPLEGGVKNPADRVIPFLPGKILFGRSQTREVALKRKDAIDEYCQALIKLPKHIAESELVQRFFEPNDEDISNMTSGQSATKKGGGGQVSNTAEVISEPVLMEQYVVQADYKKLGRGQISLVAGDVVEVIEKSDNGWWFISVEDEQGWAPCSYLEPLGGLQEEATVKSCDGEKYLCTKKYEAQLEDEISLDVGAIVQCFQKSSDGWWQVRYKGKEGWAPRAYLKPAPTLIGDDSGQAMDNTLKIKTKDRKPSTGVAPPPRRKTVRKKVQEAPQRSDRGNDAVQDHSHDVIYVATSDYRSSVGDKSVNISQGSNIEVIEKAPNGWWYIKVGAEEGWVPASIMERRRKGEEINFSQDDDDLYGNVKTIFPDPIPDKNNFEPLAKKDENANEPDSPDFELYETVGAYVSTDDSGISFKKGEYVEVLDKDESGWWFIKIGNDEGWAPSTYLAQKEGPKRIVSKMRGRKPSDQIDTTPGPPKPNRSTEVTKPRSYENTSPLDAPTQRERAMSELAEKFSSSANQRPRTGTSGMSGGVPILPGLSGGFCVPPGRGKPAAPPAKPAIPPAKPSLPATRKTSEPTPTNHLFAARPGNERPKSPLVGRKHSEPGSVHKPVPPRPGNEPLPPKPGDQKTISAPTSRKNSDDTHGRKILRQESSDMNRRNPPPRPNDSPATRRRYAEDGNQSPRSPGGSVLPGGSGRKISRPSRPPPKPKDCYVAINSFSDPDEGMLSLNKGDIVQVLEKDDGGWWFAKLGDNTGWVPSNFLKPDE